MVAKRTHDMCATKYIFINLKKFKQIKNKNCVNIEKIFDIYNTLKSTIFKHYTSKRYKKKFKIYVSLFKLQFIKYKGLAKKKPLFIFLSYLR